MTGSVLVLGAGPVQVGAIRQARQSGLHVIAVDANPNAPGLSAANVGVVSDITDVDAAIALAKAHVVRGVLCVAVEAAVRTVAGVATELGLPGMTPEAALNATDKHRMRTIWAERGIPSAASTLCDDFEQAVLAASAHGFPVVLKPRDNAGSRGVSRVDRVGDVRGAFESARASSPSLQVLVETYLEGPEISVEGFAFNGDVAVLALSDKVRSHPPSLVDTAVLFPSSQPVPVQRLACEVVTAAVKALGIDMAPVHAELIVTDDGPRMVELAARGPGFKVFTEMIPWVTGVDTVGELLRMSLGLEPRLVVSRHRAAVLRFPEAGPGTVRCIEGVEAARAIPGVADVELYVGTGDVVRPLACGADRIGHILVLAESRPSAEEIAARAEAAICLEVGA